MRQLRFSFQALQDLSDVGDFIAQDNPGRAATFVGELEGRCRRLVDFPLANPAHPKVGNNLRVAVWRNYAIYYAVADDILEIRRIVHGARNISPDDLAR